MILHVENIKSNDLTAIGGKAKRLFLLRMQNFTIPKWVNKRFF